MAAMAATSQPAARLRLFVAITLPEAWRRYLAGREQALERLAPGYARWVAPDLMHLTLVFLGELPAATLPTVQAALADAAAGQPAFPLSLGRLGHFGGAVPRVLWVEARAPAQRLPALHTALCVALTARAVPFDGKPLVPHLTLGRARRDAAPAAGRALASRLPTLAAPPPPAPCTVDAIHLIRSDLSPRGPRYTPLGAYPLTERRLPGSQAISEP
ncbi:MAG TPA: RNA 2',3'-cyclic phosphodiesterase [Chloroflexota bacterium]|nr:RNA 2',3'-cyclic phosphodiesterase [Chloroflexota bacterium]